MDDFNLLVLPGAHATGVAATMDMLRAAGSLAPRAGTPGPRWRVSSPAGGIVQLQSGLQLNTSRLTINSSSDMSTWVVPGLGLNTPAEVQERLAQPDAVRAVHAIQRHVARGGRVAAGCSAVFLLAAAGVLEGRRVTTTWWLAPLLQRMRPGCTVDAARMVCADGPVTTAGAAFAQCDLMLHLLRSNCGAALTDLVSRFMLADEREAQSTYVVPEVLASGDALVGRIIARAEQALPDMPSVSALAGEFCVSERTLARHVRRATGQTTLALLQSVRLRRARWLLATSKASVEDVAAAVGYGDPTALRRLMRRVSGASPRQYRPAVGRS